MKKTPPRFQVGDLVLVEWMDSTRPATQEWSEIGDLDLDVTGCRSAGWVIHVDDKQVVLGHNMDPVNDHVCGAIAIPLVSVTKSVKLG